MVTVLYLHRVRARVHRWGKMPITTYKSDFINECGLTDMNMPPSPKVHLQRRRALPLVSPGMRPAVPTRGPFSSPRLSTVPGTHVPLLHGRAAVALWFWSELH